MRALPWWRAPIICREIRNENTMKNAHGETVGLREGAQVDVVIVADDRDTIKKPE
jgi:hypothetical protein